MNQALANSNDPNDVGFFLWTRLNNVNEDILVYGDSQSVINSHFFFGRPTKVQVHGFVGNGREQRMLDMKDAFLTQGDYNVISVDWELLAGPDYDEAAANTQIVGTRLAEFLQFLMSSTGASIESIHLIGFSFGAQVDLI